MARKKKKNSISPDELLFNFADWTESSSGQTPSTTNITVVPKPSENAEPSAHHEVPEPSNFTESSDLQYMEDTMFWALRQIDGIDDKNQIRLIAMESASVALSGVVLHNIYQLQSYPYGRIDGYQLVALYYASFATAFPNMLESINLSYAPQFKAAQNRFQEFIASHA